MIKSVNFIIFLAIATTQLWAGEVNTFAKAKDLAAQASKPILIDFWSDN